MWKKHLGKTLLLAVFSAILLGSGAFAQAVEVYDETAVIQPRTIGIVKADCELTISSRDDIANCYGRVSMATNYDSEFTLSLERSTDKENWSNVASWNGAGSQTLSKTCFVTPGYYYRCTLTIDVYDSFGNYIITYTEPSVIVTH